MDKKQLSQLRPINREIENIKKDLEQAGYSIKPEISTDIVKGSGNVFPYIYNVPIKIHGVDWSDYDKKVDRLKGRLQKRLEKLLDKLDELNEYIETIEDSEMRQIINYRYIEGLTWQEIAKHMGYQDESAPRKKIERFLK